jgi:Protein of unknown function (DUF1236)
MRTTHLLSTIAAAMLLGAGAAAAQGLNGPVKPERAPAAQQNAPAEKIAPSMHAGQRRGAETIGQGSAQRLKPGSGSNAELNEHGTVGAAPQKEQSGGKNGMSREENSPRAFGGKADNNGKPFNSESGRNNEHARGADNDTSGKSANERSRHEGQNGTTGQGAAASGAKLSSEQRTKITTIIKKEKVEPTRLNISVHVGARVPASVHYYPLPTAVVEVYPEWRGYNYILVGDQIVIIDPDTCEVVAILET